MMNNGVAWLVKFQSSDVTCSAAEAMKIETHTSRVMWAEQKLLESYQKKTIKTQAIDIIDCLATTAICNDKSAW